MSNSPEGYMPEEDVGGPSIRKKGKNKIQETDEGGNKPKKKQRGSGGGGQNRELTKTEEELLKFIKDRKIPKEELGHVLIVLGHREYREKKSAEKEGYKSLAEQMVMTMKEMNDTMKNTMAPNGESVLHDMWKLLLEMFEMVKAVNKRSGEDQKGIQILGNMVGTGIAQNPNLQGGFLSQNTDNSTGSKLPEPPAGFFDGIVWPNDQKLQDWYPNNVPELGAILTPNTIPHAEAASTSTHSNEERLQKQVDELNKKVEALNNQNNQVVEAAVQSALFRMIGKSRD